MASIRKTVIIVGATEGLGAAIARVFYAQGNTVIIAARKDNGFAKKLGKRAFFAHADARQEADHKSLAELARRKTGRLDVYINCAGFSLWSPLSEVDELFFQEMIDTNLKGTFWGCKTAAGLLRRGGCIINVASLAGKRGSANNSVYCASKFGVIGLTQALAKELGPRGIRVNAVCPVYVETPGLKRALAQKHAPPQGKSVSEYLKNFSNQQSALGRLPTADEVAQVCVFLASDAASAITGQSLNVDCGVLPS